MSKEIEKTERSNNMWIALVIIFGFAGCNTCTYLDHKYKRNHNKHGKNCEKLSIYESDGFFIRADTCEHK